jgi:hypothetical protein
MGFVKEGHPPIKVADLYLWYSPTCGTNWGQIVNTFSCRGCPVSDISITRDYDLPSPAPVKVLAPVENIFPDDPQDAEENHTYMVYAPTAPVKFCVTVPLGSYNAGSTNVAEDCIAQKR